MKKIIKILLIAILSSPFGGWGAFAQIPVMVNEVNQKGSSSEVAEIVKINGPNGDIIIYRANNSANGSELWKYDVFANQASLIKDITPVVASSVIRDLTVFNNQVFFTCYDPTNGYELWKTDGTSGGTTIFKDIIIGSVGSNPQLLTVANNTLFFIANSNTELWVSDGTVGGTVLAKSVFPTSNDGGIYDKLYKIGNRIYFRAYNSINDTQQLWTSDGTTAGTIQLKDFGSGNFYGFIEYLNNAYFGASDNINGNAIWKSDGTVAGTTLVTLHSANSFAVLGSTLYFSENASLWKSDGTNDGTVFVSSLDGYVLNSINGSLYFINSLTNGYEIYKSDGTNGGSVFLKFIERFDNVSEGPVFLGTSNGSVFFAAKTRETGYELWKTDGTPLGTTLLKDIRPDIFGSNPTNFSVVNNTIYFAANDGTTGFELWKTDGTTATTIRLDDLLNNNFSSNPNNVGKLNNFLFYNASTPLAAEYMYILNTATSVTSREFTVLNRASDYLVFNNKLYFGAQYGAGRELCESDGSVANSVQTKDIYSGATGLVQNSSNPSELTTLGSIFMFAATDATGTELWKSDGTNAGTIQVKDINPAANSSSPKALIEFNGTLYFTADDGTNGRELWKSGGSLANTVMVGNLNTSIGTILVNAKLVKTTNNIYFGASNNATTGLELYASTGTGYNLVKDINAGISSSSPINLTAGIGTTLFFSAYDATNGRELWKTDGTLEGTVLIKDIHNGSNDSNPSNLFFWNNILYFSAFDGTNGAELWRSDGTAGGTFMLKDIHGGSSSGNPANFCIVNNALYFSAKDARNGIEVWKTDGTASGTVLVYNLADDFNGEINDSNPTALTFLNNTLFFAADNKRNGVELFSYKPCTVLTANYNQFAYFPSVTQHLTQSIVATNKIKGGKAINYFAPNSILLSPGFSVSGFDISSTDKNVFRADIKGCY